MARALARVALYDRAYVRRYVRAVCAWSRGRTGAGSHDTRETGGAYAWCDTCEA